MNKIQNKNGLKSLGEFQNSDFATNFKKIDIKKKTLNV